MATKVSGEMVSEVFTLGWAIRAGNFNVAHIWLRIPGGDIALARCRPTKFTPIRLTNGQVGLFHPGNFPLCKRCCALTLQPVDGGLHAAGVH